VTKRPQSSPEGMRHFARETGGDATRHLTVLDHYAAAAMQFLMSRHGYTYEKIAEQSFKLAEAMMRQRAEVMTPRRVQGGTVQREKGPET
jgi:hypothetical protein